MAILLSVARIIPTDPITDEIPLADDPAHPFDVILDKFSRLKIKIYEIDAVTTILAFIRGSLAVADLVLDLESRQ
ncbi:MAG: hypothetical protein PHU49_14595 [Syntrophorhabdaceae bacterium]|jgi:polyphosphate kinase|nr:hypothetical protein [Syntrophorhabdaceae bacterium]MDD5245235.1 hypothetical protein [Syntrophorhabdaceae bacterium]